MKLIGVLLLTVICLNKQTALAQDTIRKAPLAIIAKDSTKKDVTKHKLPFSTRLHNAIFVDHAPNAAGIMSAIIPGMGQAYNHKYWKMPIIYTGGVLITYLFITNYSNYMQTRTSYIDKLNNITANDPFPQYDATQIKSLCDYYRRNLDILALSGVALYALNIVDAVVDAHLYKFDISNNLSLNINPRFLPLYHSGMAYGLSLTIHIN